ncbi:hypothetical protein KL949_005246 [Ogataea haglerorum]|nr:hypothetical protein KL913_005203 [Ogataea haglerorum]KAG7713497.1 hypothetical protein KL949_005246 [Ogataea haglerorum]
MWVRLHLDNEEQAALCVASAPTTAEFYENNVIGRACSPLATRHEIDNPDLLAVARKHKRTCGHILNAWFGQEDDRFPDGAQSSRIRHQAINWPPDTCTRTWPALHYRLGPSGVRTRQREISAT